MSNRAYEFESTETALWAANTQLRAVNGTVNELLSLVFVLADRLRANDETNIYASALGCVETVLESMYEDTLHEFVVSNQAIQADLSPDNQAFKE